MRFILLVITFVTLALSAACQRAETTKTETKSTPTSSVYQKTPDPADDVPRITVEDAKKDFDAETAVFVDTRSEYAYNQERIKGAINIPMEKFETSYQTIPTGKKIIAYCD